MTTIFIAITLAFSFGFWFILYGLECYMSGGLMEGTIKGMTRCLWEEILYVLPGGTRRKGEYIKKRIEGFENGSMCSCSTDKSWTYQEIRDGNLYVEVGKAMLPDSKHFFFMHICVPFLPICLLLTVL